jgi:hypothetical protein
VSGATIAVSWSTAVNSSASCVTGATGQCTFRTASLKAQQPSVTMTINSVTAPGATYASTANHSQVPGATATSITVSKP